MINHIDGIDYLLQRSDSILVHLKKNIFFCLLQVDCLASGLPDPAVSWSLPDGTMVNSVLQGEERAGRGRRLIVFNNGTLLVPAVGRGEEGEYTCYAENQGGQDTMKVKLKLDFF